MKALSIMEPHASLLLTPYKNIETRSWKTNYRGEILLHASKKFPSLNQPGILPLCDVYTNYAKEAGLRTCFLSGFIYAKAELIGCELMTEENIERLLRDRPCEVACGYYKPGRYMWIMENVTPLKWPIRWSGHLGLWNYEGGI